MHWKSTVLDLTSKLKDCGDIHILVLVGSVWMFMVPATFLVHLDFLVLTMNCDKSDIETERVFGDIHFIKSIYPCRLLVCRETTKIRISFLRCTNFKFLTLFLRTVPFVVFSPKQTIFSVHYPFLLICGQSETSKATVQNHALSASASSTASQRKASS